MRVRPLLALAATFVALGSGSAFSQIVTTGVLGQTRSQRG